VGVSSWGAGGFGAFVAAVEGVGAGWGVGGAGDGWGEGAAGGCGGWGGGVDAESARFNALWREGAEVERIEVCERVVEFGEWGRGGVCGES
jgi:hypothetical protein